MKKLWRYGSYCFYSIFAWFITFPVRADLPTPPQEDLASSAHDWIDVGGSMGYRALKIVCIVLGVMILAAAASGIAKSYQTAHERQDLGHFFKMLVVGLIASAIGIALVYGGYTIIPTSN